MVQQPSDGIERKVAAYSYDEISAVISAILGVGFSHPFSERVSMTLDLRDEYDLCELKHREFKTDVFNVLIGV